MTQRQTQVRSRSALTGDNLVMSIRYLSDLAVGPRDSRTVSPAALRHAALCVLMGAALNTGLSLTRAQAQAPVGANAASANASRQMSADTAQELTIEQVLQAAGLNLDVAVARRDYEAAQADIVAADHAPLPVLSAKAGSIDLQNGVGAGPLFQQKRIDKSVGLDWTWERGNKRALRTQTSRLSAQAAQADWQDMVTAQRILALQGFYDWLAAHQRVGEMQGIATSTLALAQAAQRRLQAGDLSAQDAARTDIEAARAQADARQAILDWQRAALALAPLINMRGNPLQWRPKAAWPAVADQAEAVQQAQARLDDLVEQRPDIRAARERAQAAQSALELARAQKSTDLTWGGSVDHFPSATGTTARQMELRLQLPLQWGYSYEGEIARAAALQAQSQDWLERARLQARAELQGLLQVWDNTRERFHAFEQDILPRARRVAQQAELAYTQGALSLTDLLDARRTLRTIQLDAITAQADLAKAQGTWQLRTTAPAP